MHTYKHTCSPNHAWLILIYHSHNEELFTGKDCLENKNYNNIPRILHCQFWLKWESMKEMDASLFSLNIIKYDNHINLSFVMTQKQRFTLNPTFCHKNSVIFPCQMEYGNIKIVSIFLPKTQCMWLHLRQYLVYQAEIYFLSLRRNWWSSNVGQWFPQHYSVMMLILAGIKCHLSPLNRK